MAPECDQTLSEDMVVALTPADKAARFLDFALREFTEGALSRTTT